MTERILTDHIYYVFVELLKHYLLTSYLAYEEAAMIIIMINIRHLSVTAYFSWLHKTNHSHPQSNLRLVK
ncbi:hypothetical protein INR49_015127 [Caranx melampygus]|nr:hypothetical protein INR49_015127 [Caranx melampygus]